MNPAAIGDVGLAMASPRLRRWLLLAAALLAWPAADGRGQAPILIEILDPHAPGWPRARPATDMPLRMVDGARLCEPRSLEEAREWLRLRARHEAFADRDTPEVAPGVRASAREVVIRCAPTQDFGWVQAVLHACTLLPGRPRNRQLAESPLLHRVFLEPEGGGRRLRLSLPLAAVWTSDREEMGRIDVHLEVPDGDRDRPNHRKEVAFIKRSPEGGDALYGLSHGLAPASLEPGDLHLVLDPPEALLRLRHDVRRRASGQARPRAYLDAAPAVPAICAMTVLGILEDEGVADLRIARLSPVELRRVCRGEAAPPTGLSALEAAARAWAASAPSGVDWRACGYGADSFTGNPRRTVIPLSSRWLAAEQRADGSWDGDVATTALAALAFLGAGHTHREGALQARLASALDWLARAGAPGGRASVHAPDREGLARAMASTALTTAWHMTHATRWKAPARAALRHLLATQRRGGAWAARPDHTDDDLHTTAWATIALIAATRSALVEDDPSTSALRRALAFLETSTGGGLFRERSADAPARVSSGASPETTLAAALFARCWAPGADEAALRAVARRLLPEPDAATPDGDPERRLFEGLLHYRLDPERFRAWSRGLVPLLESARADAGIATGSLDPPAGSDRSRATTTALGLMSFALHYRYRRTFGTW